MYNYSLSSATKSFVVRRRCFPFFHRGFWRSSSSDVMMDQKSWIFRRDHHFHAFAPTRFASRRPLLRAAGACSDFGWKAEEAEDPYPFISRPSWRGLRVGSSGSGMVISLTTRHHVLVSEEGSLPTLLSRHFLDSKRVVARLGGSHKFVLALE